MERKPNPRGRPRLPADLMAVAVELVRGGAYVRRVADYLGIGERTIFRAIKGAPWRAR